MLDVSTALSQKYKSWVEFPPKSIKGITSDVDFTSLYISVPCVLPVELFTPEYNITLSKSLTAGLSQDKNILFPFFSESFHVGAKGGEESGKAIISPPKESVNIVSLAKSVSRRSVTILVLISYACPPLASKEKDPDPKPAFDIS